MLVLVLQGLLPLGNSDETVPVSIDFPSNFKGDDPFLHKAYHYSCADWNGLQDHLRDVQWEIIFKLGASAAAATELCKWVQVGVDVYIPHHKCQVKPHSSPWFSAACAAVIAPRNDIFHLQLQNYCNLLDLK